VRRPQTEATAHTRPLADPRERTLALSGASGGTDAPQTERLLVDRYRLERRLGAGGFGVVWQAWDERLEREVAVKAVPREGDDERPEREARAAARLNHPGIVALYELVADDEHVYLVSELVHGSTLAELIRGRALSDRDVARVGAALCEALGHAHARGVIHRDVKPGNVMVVADPAARGFAKLTDFGVAHVATGDPLTRTGDVVGTLAYMAPEQAEGTRPTPASDVYALALTLYEAWTGSNPVRAKSPAVTARRLGSELPPLGSRRRDLPVELCEVIDDALDPDPAIRPGLGELRHSLEDAEPVLADRGGLDDPGTLERFGLTRVGRLPGERWAAMSPLAGRLGAGLAAGLLVLAALSRLGPEPPLRPLAAAGVACLAVAMLPRIGWIAAALGVCGWLASPGADRPGAALVLAAALAPTPLLLPRAGKLWSVPVLAPLLGMIAIAPAYVAVAGLVQGAWRRAGLAAAGFLWLVLGEVLTGRNFLFGVPDGVAPALDWRHSAGSAAENALYPLVSSPALAPIAVFACLAAVLPLVVRGRYVALDLLAAALWAAALAAALIALGDALAATTALSQPRGAAAGAVLGALLAVAAATVREPAEPQGTAHPAPAS
jgi:eukaryotic-like serine/threonine-protein kinase